ncbi:MAG: hypothetical protein MH204_02245, partial [Fimbriimonadaceae bacterium]|nr:hypothetical protein [Fimbriimonadaceae bacterium]
TISGPGISQTNTYNGLDTRVGSTTNSVAQTFLRDGAYVTDPVLKDSSATYTPGTAERRGGASRFLHSGLKSVEGQTNTSQVMAAARQYDAFGNVLSGHACLRQKLRLPGGIGRRSVCGMSRVPCPPRRFREAAFQA